MEKFSTILYKSPGDQHGPFGKTYKWVGAKSKDEMEEKLSEGWHASLVGACEATNIVKKEEEKRVVADNAPPTRKELEEKATSLGVPFNARTKDDVLLAKINEAVKE